MSITLAAPLLYTQFQRFIATILLFSILLQSCGNPNCKMVEPVEPATSEKTCNPRKVKKRASEESLQVLERSSESATAPQVNLASEINNVPSNQAAHAPSRAARKGSQRSTPPPTAKHSPSLPDSGASQVPRPLVAPQKPLLHQAKPRHTGQEKAPIAPHTQHKQCPETSLPVFTSQLSPSTTAVAHQQQAQTTSSTDDQAHQSLAVPPNPPTQAYLSAQGQQISFQEQAGVWKAQVQDVWGRTQVLPVICAPEYTPQQAIEALASKALGQHKYGLHILETAQPPWAPRVVYVGALGLRGGGNTSSSSSCAYPGWIYGGDNSDGEPDGEVRSGGYTFYRSNTNNWCVDLTRSYGRGYITRSNYTMTLSANDIRSVGSWSFHDCNVGWGDCYAPNIDYSTIRARREERREERRKRRQEAARRRQKEQRQRQEEARRAEEQRRRQEEARRLREEVETARRRVAALEAKRRQEEERTRRQKEAWHAEEQRRRQEEARRAEEERRRQEEAAAKIITGRRALIQKLDTEAAKTAKKDLDQFWSESTVIAKQQAQIQKALKCLSTTKVDKQTHAQEYVGTPYLGNAVLKASKPDDRSDDSSDADTNHDRKEKAPLQATRARHTTPHQEPLHNRVNHKGLPNVGNTCYLNAGLQVIARLYPNLFSHKQDNRIAQHGKSIIEKLTSQNSTGVNTTEAGAFRDNLIQTYNVGKRPHDQLQQYQQEDAAPVFNFLLQQAKVKEVESYRTKVHPEGRYATTTTSEPNTGPTLVLPLTKVSAAVTMNQLVAKSLRGERVTDVKWGQDDEEVLDDAVMGDKLSFNNLKDLSNSILPIWVHRFGQTNNGDTGSAEKINTSITNPFSLNISAEHLIEQSPYTGKLVGFIHHVGGLHGGHYTAYVQHASGAWVCYNDTHVTTLDTPPLQEAQKAYIYFYKAVDSTHETVRTKEEVTNHQLQRQEQPDALSHLYDTHNDTAYGPTQANDKMPSHRNTDQLPIVVEDVTKAEARDNEISHDTQYKNPATAVQNQKIKQTEKTLQKSQTRLERTQEQLETTRGQWIRQQVVVMAHTLNHQPLLDYLAGKENNAINEPYGQGKTALHHAVVQNNHDVVQWLVGRKAAMNVKDSNGFTPLHWAAQKGHTAVAELLLENEADIEATDKWGCTPLHRAAEEGHKEVAELLLENEADIKVTDKWGRTPLHRAAEKGHTAVAELLLKHGVSIESKNRKGLTPLHQAVIDNRAAIVELLLKHGAAIATKDNLYDTPLHWAAQKAHMAIIRLLLARGATIDTPNRWGYTPLHRAVIKGHIAAVELLLVKGADSSIQDSRKKTALDIAIEQNHEEVATLLRAAQVPGWHPQAYTATATNTTNTADQTEAAEPSTPIPDDNTSLADSIDSDQSVVAPSEVVKQPSTPTATTTQNALPKNVKDAPELARAKVALKSAREAYEAAQQKLENAKSACQEAQDAVAQAKTASVRSKKTQRHVAHLNSIALEKTANAAEKQGSKASQSDTSSVYNSALEEVSSATYTSNDTPQSDTSSVYDSALEETFDADPHEGSVAATPSDAKEDFKEIGEQGPLVDAMWDWNQEQDILTNALIDNLTFSTHNTSTIPNDTEATHEQAEISARATTPPITEQGKATSPGVSPRSVFYAFPSFSRVAKAVTIPFDNRPLAPLVQDVNRVCLQLNECALCTEQLNTSLQEGKQLMRSCQQQSYVSTLNWHERVQYKTLEDKLSCHVRFYQRLVHWTKCLEKEEQQAFETAIVPVLKQRFLCGSTDVQQALLTYWERNGTCYADHLLEAPVQDWLKVSLYRDIVLAEPVNNDTLLQEGFMQEIERLVQHREGPTQQKLLTQLFWALRSRQQENQLDLLALHKLMAWLPNEGEQALQLLNNEAYDWHKTLKAHWIRTQLAVFEDRFQADDITTLCDALVQLPWDHTRTDFFLRAVEQEQDLVAFKDLLLFLAKYSVEDNTLFDVLHAEPPENTVGPCHFIHHTLACKLLKTPIQLFDQHAEALHKQITTWLNTSLGAFDALYAFLTALKSADTNASVRSEQALQLREVLTLLNDYGTAATVGTKTFKKLTSQPLHQWEAITHQLVIDATFRTSHELNVEELIQEIAENVPGVHFAGDAQQLQRSYDAVMATYQGPSEVLQAALTPAAEDNEEDEEDKEEEEEKKVLRQQYLAEAQQPIASWQAATITRWSALVKKKPEQVSQRELLAVIKHAVALHHGFTPRATQLLSVLTLLNTPEKTGRLAQIYTGEGKSLIVAMLAAIHALKGQKVDVLTTSTELSIPEVKKQKPFFEILGLTIGENSKKNATDDEARYAIYQKDIVYGTAEDFQADIISTEFFRRNIRGSRGFGVVLVDEVDSMLYDGRNYSIQLSSLTPAMNHLEIVLGSIWNHVNQIASRLRTIDGQCYLIKAKEFQDIPGGGVVLPAGQTLAECSRPVDDQVGFLQQNTATRIEQLIRKLTPEERENLAVYKAQERRVKQLQEEVQQLESELEDPNYSKRAITKKLDAKKVQYEAALETLKQLPWYQAGGYLEIPAHLQDFARLQIAPWIKSAIHALLYYQKDRHYCINKGSIVAIDYSNTGVLQYNTVWENGLHQFLQIKEGLKVKPEGISTNFCSKPGYFKNYEHRIYGLTGTLGNETTRRFLTSVYGVDMVHVPSYKQREITSNKTSHYRCKELNPYLLTTSTDWHKAIMENTLRPARNGQAVLVLCKHVDQVLPLKEELAKQYDADKLFTYTGKSQFEKHQVDSGEIIIATNIAGRGTDLTTSQAVEDKGGLHVCISFLPDSYRVELQNAGRTARQGKKGSAQLVLRTTGDETLETLRTQRDKDEAKAIEQAEQDVERMIAADRLFMRYCGVEESFFPAMEALRKANLSQQLSAQWEVYVEQTQSADSSQAAYEEYIQKRLKVVLAKHEEELRERDEAVTQTMQGAACYTEAVRQEEHDALVQNLTATLKKETPLAAFCKERETQMRIAFVRTLQTQKEIPADVFAAFVEGQVYVPSTYIGTSPTSIETSHFQQIIQKATGWGWTEHERHGSQERWGLWLKGDKTAEDQALAARQQRFDGFAKTLKEDASKDQLIKNPYYFVRKGNELLQDGSLRAAIRAYNRAIDLDPPYSVNARYNKARALVSYEENKSDHTVVKKELKEAQELIGQQKIVLLGFDALVGQTGKKPGTSEHVQHQLDVLSQQEKYIQAAIDVVERAQEKDWDVEITEVKAIQTVFEEAEGDRTEALRESTANGFTHVFTIKEKEPTNWWGIISVALIGLTQIAAGVFINVCTLGVGTTWGNAFISEGVSDLITAVQASIQGGYFSWASWALQKAISLAITLASAGIEKMKQLFQSPQKVTGEVATKVAEQQTEAQIRKKCLDTSIKRVGLEFGKGVGKACANALVNYGVDQLLMKNIEKEIAERVAKKVTQSLGENKWVQAALALDIKNENNYWQNRLLQEGMALLAEKKDDKVLYALKEVAKGVASNTIPGAQAAMQSAAMIKALDEVMTMTDSFLAELHNKIGGYEKEIKKAQEERQEVEKQQQQEATEQHQENQQISAPPPPVDEEDLEVPFIAFQENYKSDLRSYYHDNRPSDAKNLCGSFSSAITSRIANKIQGDIVRPATGALVNMGIDKMLEGVEKSVQQDEQDCRISGAPVYYAKKMANEKLKKDKKNKHGKDRTEQHVPTERTQEDKTPSDNKQPSAGDTEHNTKSVKPDNKTIAERIRNGAPVTYLEMAALAAELERPIIVRDEQNGNRLLTLGSKQKGKPIKMGYIPAIDGGIGHFVHPDKPDSAIPSSGLNNCALNVAASQTGLDGADLRERVAKRVAQSRYTQKLHRATETLRAYKPAAMIEGGKVLEWVHPQYLYYRYQGDNINAQSIKERCERVEDLLAEGFEDAALFGSGVGNALGNNLLLGAVPRGNLSAYAFVYGQQVGDGLSMGIGAVESWLGSSMTGGGGAVMVASGGVLVPIGVPVSAGGIALTTHGGLVMSKAILEFSKTKKSSKREGGKESGRGDPHTNLKAKSTAQQRYEDTKNNLAKYREEYGNKCDKKKLQWFKTQIQHWKRQADKTGETHGRKGKGHR